MELPSKLIKTGKYRTEIDSSTEFPQFFNCYFEFSKLNIGNRITLRFGLYNTQMNKETESKSNNELFKNSLLIGVCNLLFTVSIIDTLRKHKFIESDLIFEHPDKYNSETGHIYFKIELKSESLEMKYNDDNSEIETCYYDPFETDPTVIKDVNVII